MSNRSSFLSLKRVHLNALLSNLIVGLNVGAIGVLFYLSFTALIFSGRLESHLAAGIGLVMFSVAATRIITAFISTANSLIHQVRQRIVDGSPVRFIVFDFIQVSEIDASAVHSFTRLKPLILKHDLTLVLTQLAPNV
jgi:hypothetical protein